jgi:hypothetical protein
MMESKKTIENMYKITYERLTMLYRDVDLGQYGKAYEKGMIIREKTLTGASRYGGGVFTSHRYAILSNNYKDADAIGQDRNEGLCVMKKDSYFKVLDVYDNQGKTQITLLQLPEKDWEFIENVNPEVEDKLVKHVRSRFDQCLEEAPVPMLTTDNWLERCSSPLGMDEEGNLFPLSDENKTY